MQIVNEKIAILVEDIVAKRKRTCNWAEMFENSDGTCYVDVNDSPKHNPWLNTTYRLLIDKNYSILSIELKKWT